MRWIAFLVFLFSGCQHRVAYSVTVHHVHVPPMTTVKMDMVSNPSK